MYFIKPANIIQISQLLILLTPITPTKTAFKNKLPKNYYTKKYTDTTNPLRIKNHTHHLTKTIKNFANTFELVESTDSYYWIFVRIQKRAASQILLTLHKEPNPHFDIKKNILETTSEELDFEGFKYHENQLRVHKTFIGRAFITIYHAGPIEDPSAESTVEITIKTDSQVGKCPTDQLHECNGYTCDITPKCVCQNNNFGRTCSKTYSKIPKHETNLEKEIFLKPFEKFYFTGTVGPKLENSAITISIMTKTSPKLNIIISESESNDKMIFEREKVHGFHTQLIKAKDLYQKGQFDLKYLVKQQHFFVTVMSLETSDIRFLLKIEKKNWYIGFEKRYQMFFIVSMVQSGVLLLQLVIMLIYLFLIFLRKAKDRQIYQGYYDGIPEEFKDEQDESFDDPEFNDKDFDRFFPEIDIESFHQQGYEVLDIDCDICYEMVSGVNHSARQISICGHVFHGDCLKIWLTTNSECSICEHKLCKRFLLENEMSDRHKLAKTLKELKDNQYFGSENQQHIEMSESLENNQRINNNNDNKNNNNNNKHAEISKKQEDEKDLGTEGGISRNPSMPKIPSFNTGGLNNDMTKDTETVGGDKNSLNSDKYDSKGNIVQLEEIKEEGYTQDITQDIIDQKKNGIKSPIGINEESTPYNSSSRKFEQRVRIAYNYEPDHSEGNIVLDNSMYALKDGDKSFRK